MSDKKQLPYYFTDEVVNGEKVGRTLGFPTANLKSSPSEEDISLGVYFGKCQVSQNKKTYHCLVYFGPRYIFNEKKNNFEVYIYDFSEFIYGKILRVELLNFIRPPLQLNSIQALKTQLEKDKIAGFQFIS